MHGCEGGKRLIAKEKSEVPSPESGHENATEKAEVSHQGQNPEQEQGKSKSGKAPADLGRALKTVYDDTLREDVPKDFLDLLGKLN